MQITRAIIAQRLHMQITINEIIKFIIMHSYYTNVSLKFNYVY